MTANTMLAAGLSAGAAQAINGLKANLTAAGTVSTDAALIVSDIVNATGAASAGIRLPPASPGDTFWIFNSGGNTILLYPPSTGQLNGGTATTGTVSLTTLLPCIAKCIDSVNFMVIKSA